MSIDSKGTVGLSRDTSSVANSHIKLAEGTNDNQQDKVDTSIGVTTEKCEGDRDYGVKGKVGYTHFSQKLAHKATPTIDIPVLRWR